MPAHVHAFATPCPACTADEDAVVPAPAITYRRVKHSAHNLYTGAPLWDLSEWIIRGGREAGPPPGEPNVYYHSGFLKDGEPTSIWTRTETPDPAPCERCPRPHWASLERIAADVLAAGASACSATEIVGEGMVEITVEGGDDHAVAQAILDALPSFGVRTRGAQRVDVRGVPVYFTRGAVATR